MNSELAKMVQARIKQIIPGIQLLRQQVHREPEIGLDTYVTRDRIKAALGKSSLVFREPLIGADLIADLKGRTERTICLRADMDGLPIQETSQKEYASIKPNMMHACGHDGHLSILVGAALVLNAFRDLLPVSVRFIFQPGEEMVCGGKTMVELGVCKNASAVYALHGWPGLQAGQIAAKSGPLFAAAAMYTIELRGCGTHGATPECGNNPILVTPPIISGLQQLHEQEKARTGSIVSVCSVIGGSSNNIIPDKIVIKGTVRYLSEEAGDFIEASITRIVSKYCNQAGIQEKIDYERSYPWPVVNSFKSVARLEQLVREYLPSSQWLTIDQPKMVSEDFAFYLRDCEGAMFLLGLGENHPSLHHPQFDFEDSVLETGIFILSMLALEHD